jgi:hypothetical protein
LAGGGFLGKWRGGEGDDSNEADLEVDGVLDGGGAGWILFWLACLSIFLCWQRKRLAAKGT